MAGRGNVAKGRIVVAQQRTAPINGSRQPEVLPPHDTAAEEAVIAAILMDPAMLDELAAIVTANDFFHEAHAWYFEALQGIHARGSEITVPTLWSELNRLGKMDAVGGESAIVDLLGRHFTATGSQAHAHMVARDAYYRRLIVGVGQIARIAYAGGPDAEAVRDSVLRVINSIPVPANEIRRTSQRRGIRV